MRRILGIPRIPNIVGGEILQHQGNLASFRMDSACFGNDRRPDAADVRHCRDVRDGAT